MKELDDIAEQLPPVVRKPLADPAYVQPPKDAVFREDPHSFSLPPGVSVWDHIHVSYVRAAQAVYRSEAPYVAAANPVSSIPRIVPADLRKLSMSPYFWSTWRMRGAVLRKLRLPTIGEVFCPRVMYASADAYRRFYSQPQTTFAAGTLAMVDYWKAYARNRLAAGLAPMVACPPWFVAMMRAERWEPHL